MRSYSFSFHFPNIILFLTKKSQRFFSERCYKTRKTKSKKKCYNTKMFSEVSKKGKGSFPHCTISIIKMENQKLSPGTTAGALVIPIGNFIIVSQAITLTNYEYKRQLCK